MCACAIVLRQARDGEDAETVDGIMASLRGDQTINGTNRVHGVKPRRACYAITLIFCRLPATGVAKKA